MIPRRRARLITNAFGKLWLRWKSSSAILRQPSTSRQAHVLPGGTDGNAFTDGMPSRNRYRIDAEPRSHRLKWRKRPFYSPFMAVFPSRYACLHELLCMTTCHSWVIACASVLRNTLMACSNSTGRHRAAIVKHACGTRYLKAHSGTVSASSISFVAPL